MISSDSKGGLREAKKILLVELPDEVLTAIAMYLPLESLVHFACTCKHARNIAMVDSQFQARLAKDYHVGIKV